VLAGELRATANDEYCCPGGLVAGRPVSVTATAAGGGFTVRDEPGEVLPWKFESPV
jgi:hypothetical protein